MSTLTGSLMCVIWSASRLFFDVNGNVIVVMGIHWWASFLTLPICGLHMIIPSVTWYLIGLPSSHFPVLFWVLWCFMYGDLRGKMIGFLFAKVRGMWTDSWTYSFCKLCSLGPMPLTVQPLPWQPLSWPILISSPLLLPVNFITLPNPQNITFCFP